MWDTGGTGTQRDGSSGTQRDGSSVSFFNDTREPSPCVIHSHLNGIKIPFHVF